METKTVNVYQFDELEECVQDKIISEWNTDFFDDFVLDGWKDRLTSIGFIEPEINYSGFWSQGDGASFTCKWIDFSLLISSMIYCYGYYPPMLDKALYFAEVGYIHGGINRTSYHYSHKNTVSLSLEMDIYQDVKGVWERLESDLYDSIQEYSKDLMREIYHDLEKEYEDVSSREYIMEEIDNLELLFYKNGRIFNDN